MKQNYFLLKNTMLLIMCIIAFSGYAQKTVGLDNWYNHETNPKTGKIYHYTWDDTQNSGFSQFGEVLRNKGAKLKTITTKANSKSLAGINIYIIVDPDTTTENPKPNYIMPEDVRA